MDVVSPPKPPISRDRGHNDGFPTRPRTSNRETSGNGASSQSADENRSPGTMPRALSSMLKTTTETGDIGMFSIKRPRVPPSSLATPRRISGPYGDIGMQNGVQRPRQSSLPYGIPKVDDRRRLPSYSRDNTSESLSMYDTSSQRSASRISEEPDYRSYSMTQTSYSVYPLANHRSYTSLRSQPDMIGLVQRPRSPFAYPARLKRPGFRPSSPALTDGGGVDYRRRAEIERLPHGAGHNISSPSSLYADRRRPPLPLRSEGNRSTPSLLSQPSPPRRSSTPHTLRSNGPPGSDWYRRNGQASVNTSPARSTFSLASTTNIYVNQCAPPSTTTTPGKTQPTSPLYYDYTEDFDDDNYNQPQTLDPPPQFHIEQTIPEGQPIGVESLPTSGPQSTIGSSSEDLHKGASDTSASLSSPEEVQLDGEDLEAITGPLRRDELERKSTSSGKQEADSGDRKIVRLSGLGSGAQELSSHVEEVFGLLSSESFEIPVPHEGHGGDGTLESAHESMLSGQIHKKPQALSDRTPCHSLTSSPLEIPASSLDHDLARSPICASEERKSNIETITELSRSGGHSTECVLSPNQPVEFRHRQHSSFDQDLPPQGPVESRAISSGFYKVDPGLTELVDLINTFEGANESHLDESSIGLMSLERTPIITPIITPMLPEETVIRKASSNNSLTPSLSSFNSLRLDSNQMNTQTQPSKAYLRHHRGRNIPQVSEYELTGQMPNFSHQMPHKVVPRSESPMLAPKPISPARQLKLKNSIPQLMKALPALPPEPSEKAVSVPPENSFSRYNVLRSRFSEFSSDDVRGTPVLEACEEAEQLPLSRPAVAPTTEAVADKVEQNESSSSTRNTEQIKEDDTSNTAQALPRLKLRMKASVTGSHRPAVDTKISRLEKKHPSSETTPNTHLPSPTPDEAENPKPPKFKLKVSRAANSTLNSVANAAQDTVRINRNSSESIGLHLQSPKDLFTPNVGVDIIFRQVGKHLHSRKESAASSTAGDAAVSAVALRTNQSSTTSFVTVDPIAIHSPAPSAKFLSPHEARSVFSDDSSHARHSLRKRLSNLKARIAAPYAARTGAQSYDDITWRDRNDGEAPTPPATRSIPNLQSNRSSTEARPLRRFAGIMHRQRLKAKLQEWLKGARAVFASRKMHEAAAGRDVEV